MFAGRESRESPEPKGRLDRSDRHPVVAARTAAVRAVLGPGPPPVVVGGGSAARRGGDPACDDHLAPMANQDGVGDTCSSNMAWSGRPMRIAAASGASSVNDQE
jgi:hypothetical protein